MAKIGIYNEPSAAGLGGSEYAIAVLAEVLAKDHDVEIVHHRRELTTEQLQDFSATDLSLVTLRYAEPEIYDPIFSRNLGRRYKHAKAWHSALSEPYDLFICSLHGLPPFCHAPKGVLFVLFPFALPIGLNEGDARTMLPRRFLSKCYYRGEWKRRLASYQLKTAISEFSRTWARRRWGIECELSYVPVDTDFRVVSKIDTILSVGRFSLPGEGHGKKQKEMLEAFLKLEQPQGRSWNYVSIGTLPNSRKHRSWFDSLGAEAAGHNVEFKANLGRGCLKEEFERARIFWHAAGYGEDEKLHPELTEHFGIVTVEAMAAGCVPVVIRKGGQTELVEHGVSGFLWETLNELREYTTLLMKDDALRQRMSESARRRANYFSREAFIVRFQNLLKPLLSN